MQRCVYVPRFLAGFECPVESVRFLKLARGESAVNFMKEQYLDARGDREHSQVEELMLNSVIKLSVSGYAYDRDLHSIKLKEKEAKERAAAAAAAAAAGDGLLTVPGDASATPAGGKSPGGVTPGGSKGKQQAAAGAVTIGGRTRGPIKLGVDMSRIKPSALALMLIDDDVNRAFNSKQLLNDIGLLARSDECKF